jgi:predicted transcriptional regulator YdeE
MKVMVFVKATPSSEAGEMPSQELLEAMTAYNEELVAAGIMQGGDGLKPSQYGVRVRFSGQDRMVIDGPFAETKELVAGYWMWQVKSMEEAIEWVKRCPNPMPEESEIEIRPVFELEDFGEIVTPEVEERFANMEAQMEAYALDPPRYETIPEIRIAGIRQTYDMKSRVNIPHQWDAFRPRIGNVPGQGGSAAFGVCTDMREGGVFDYISGVALDTGAEVPEGYDTVTLPAGRYAVFTHSGHISKLPQTIEAAWTKWLPNSGHEAAPAPCFERYTEEFDPESGMGGTELWIALKG